MKENMQRSLIGLALAAILLLTVSSLAQTSNPSTQEGRAVSSPKQLMSREEMYAMLDSVTQLGNKLKQAIKSSEPKWRLTQNELIDVGFFQTWKRKGQKVELSISESKSLKEASKNFDSSLISSWTTAERIKGIGDEAGFLHFSDSLRPDEYRLSVRKGKVVFTIRAPTLDIAKRFAGYALTIDDPAMKAEN